MAYNRTTRKDICREDTINDVVRKERRFSSDFGRLMLFTLQTSAGMLCLVLCWHWHASISYKVWPCVAEPPQCINALNSFP